MVYLHFPSKNTDEELMLQTKYQKLRKKKKALTEMKAPKVEPEKVNPLKRPLDPKDAKELAKKLIKTGKINIPQKPALERTTFKRSTTFERKMGSASVRVENSDAPLGSETPRGGTGADAIQFEPFNPSAASSDRRSDAGPVKPYASPPSSTNKPRPFRNSGPRDGGDMEGPRQGPGSFNKPKRGPTVYVHGHGINENFIKDLGEKYGKVVSVKINPPGSSKGFITFDKIETAETFIQEVNGTTQDDVQLEAQFARRQPAITNSIDAAASVSWQVYATNQSQKGSHQDKRGSVVYGDDDPFL